MSKSEKTKNQIESTGLVEPVDNVDESQENKQIRDEEAQINLNRDDLTYICDYCGKVNSIDSLMCKRCGKRRPRKEYVTAVNALRETKKVDTLNSAKEAKDKEVKEVKKAQDKEVREVKKGQDKAPHSNKEISAKNAEQAIIKSDELNKKADKQEKDKQEKEEQEKDSSPKIIKDNEPIPNAEKELEVQPAQSAKNELDDESLANVIDKIVAEEKEKSINRATEALVVEGENVEQDIKSQVTLYEQRSLQNSEEDILIQKEEAERRAARKAVIQIIEAEKAAEDALKINKEALSKAAIKRIEIEKELSKKQVCAEYIAEKQEIQELTEKKINADKEYIRRHLEEKKNLENARIAMSNVMPSMPTMATMAPNQQVIQPLVIVPYVNSNQPLLQYKPNQLYRYVPNASDNQQIPSLESQKDGAYLSGNQEQATGQLEKMDNPEDFSQHKPTSHKGDKFRTRLVSLLTILLIIGLGIVLWLLPLVQKNVFAHESTNISILSSLFNLIESGINATFKTQLAIMGTSEFISLLKSENIVLGILIPIGLFIVCATYLVVFIKSIIRLATGRAKNRGIFLAVLALIAIQFVVAGIISLILKLELDFFAGAGISLYILEGIGILILILSLLNPKNVTIKLQPSREINEKTSE